MSHKVLVPGILFVLITFLFSNPIALAFGPPGIIDFFSQLGVNADVPEHEPEVGTAFSGTVADNEKLASMGLSGAKKGGALEITYLGNDEWKLRLTKSNKSATYSFKDGKFHRI